MDGEIAELRQKVLELEFRLNRYHEWMEQSLEQNAQFQLNATWGLLRGTAFLLLVGLNVGLHYAWKQWTGDEPHFLVSIGLFLISGTAWFWYLNYVEKGYQGDLKKLARWPTWRETA